jgi:phosphosulfolactate synthase
MIDQDTAWGDAIHCYLGPRTGKPRRAGITAVIDKGLGTNATDDLVEMAGHVIDHVKFGFGTTATVGVEVLRRKIARLVDAGILVYPGGTLLEGAWAAGRLAAFVSRARELGFTGIEVSDGTVDMPAGARAEAIRRTQDAGLHVVTEVGSKDPERQPSPQEMAERLLADLELGADFVTIEARESGRGTGVFDATGHVVESKVDALVGPVADPLRILWEAPIQDQQSYLILRFGPNVNLANIPTADILAVEALRRGLRFETLHAALAGRAGEWAKVPETAPRHPDGP